MDEEVEEIAQHLEFEAFDDDRNYAVSSFKMYFSTKKSFLIFE